MPVVAPLRARPAVEVIFDTVSEALAGTLAAVSFAFDAAWEAVSVAFSVVDAHLREDLVAI